MRAIGNNANDHRIGSAESKFSYCLFDLYAALENNHNQSFSVIQTGITQFFEWLFSIKFVECLRWKWPPQTEWENWSSADNDEWAIAKLFFKRFLGSQWILRPAAVTLLTSAFTRTAHRSLEKKTNLIFISQLTTSIDIRTKISKFIRKNYNITGSSIWIQYYGSKTRIWGFKLTMVPPSHYAAQI